MAAIVGMVDGWDGANHLTWGRLVERVEEFLRHRWTRQTLEANPDIKAAYLRHRDRELAGRPAPNPKDPIEVVHKRQVDALNAEIAALKRTLAAYEERFVRYEYNAYRAGLSSEALGMEITKPDRGRTDGG
ncbi:MAG: hypothetical protein RQ966_20415 [Acetobacteraceae bacterium]|nr:hypothetical protein [Acetobacteraceae bacterium]